VLSVNPHPFEEASRSDVVSAQKGPRSAKEGIPILRKWHDADMLDLACAFEATTKARRAPKYSTAVGN
jgi:hypothetical protein